MGMKGQETERMKRDRGMEARPELTFLDGREERRERRREGGDGHEDGVVDGREKGIRREQEVEDRQTLGSGLGVEVDDDGREARGRDAVEGLEGDVEFGSKLLDGDGLRRACVGLLLLLLLCLAEYAIRCAC